MTSLRTGRVLASARIANRWHDLRAFVAGYCNHKPWSPVPGESNTYSHWRCGKMRHHDGMHRFNNYVWEDDSIADYLPTPDNEPARQPWQRNMTPTRRESRLRQQWLEAQYGKKSAARG